MKLHNIHSIRKKAFKTTTKSKHNYSVFLNILQRNFNADKPCQKWICDITYIPTDEGWLYAAIVKDLCLKKIVGYAFSIRIDTNLTIAALEIAVNRQKPQSNLIFHSDRGVQYASSQYRQALAKYNITQSMSKKGKGILMIMLQQKVFSAALNANLCITSTIIQEQRHRPIYSHILKLITTLCDHRNLLIGCPRLRMSIY